MSIDLEELKNEQTRISSKSNNNNDFLDKFVKMPDKKGFVVMRILPPAPAGAFGREKSNFYAATRVHRVNGRNLHCARVLVKGKWVGDCPICGYYSKLYRDADKSSPEVAKQKVAEARAIKPTERYYYNTIVRQVLNDNGEVEKNVGPKILPVGKTVHGMIINGMLGDEELGKKPLGDITNPKTGRDFRLVKKIVQSGPDSFPNYDDSSFVDEASVLGTQEEIKNWMANLHDLESLRVVKDIQEMKRQLAIHLGLIADEEKKNDSDFDPSEFQKKPDSDSVETIVREKPTPTPTSTVRKQEVVSDDGDVDLGLGKTSSTTSASAPNNFDADELEEEDFMKELRLLNEKP